MKKFCSHCGTKIKEAGMDNTLYYKFNEWDETITLEQIEHIAWPLSMDKELLEMFINFVDQKRGEFRKEMKEEVDV